jgi:hypothetical protein
MAPAKRSTDGRSRLPLLLGLAVVIAGVLLWDRWPDWSTEAARAPEASAQDKAQSEASESGGGVLPDGDGQAAPHPLAGLSLDRLGDTVRRPLFEKQRRPVVPPPPRAAAAPAPPPVAPKRAVDPNALTLLGVLTSDGQGTGAIALMRRNQTGQNVRLQEGDTVDGWTIERIETARVHIRQGDTKIALELFRKR